VELKRPQREAKQSSTYMYQDEEEESDEENAKEGRKYMKKGQ
jgi:hypothetical protein